MTETLCSINPADDTVVGGHKLAIYLAAAPVLEPQVD